MVDIPEYVAKESLDTDRRGMPQPEVMSGEGMGMEQLGRAQQGLGESLVSLGARIAQNQDNDDATKANYAIEDLRNAAAVKQQEIIKGAPESGAGMHDTMTGWMDQKIQEISKGLPEKYREPFVHKARTVRTQFSIDTADKEYGQNKDYHTRNTEKTAADRSAFLVEDPDKWQMYNDEMNTWVDRLPNMTRADKAALKQKVYETLALGKSMGDANRDPEEAKAKIGFPVTVSPGKRMPVRFEREPGRTPYTTNVNPKLIGMWEQVQGAVGFQAPVVSARRTSPKALYPNLSAEEAAKKAGYKPTSLHIHGDALDISLKGMSTPQRQALIRAASAAGFGGINVYPGGDTLHVDLGRKRHWNAQPEWAKKPIADHEAGRRVSPSGPFDSPMAVAPEPRTRVGSLDMPMVPAGRPIVVTPNQMNIIANEEDLKLEAYWDTDKWRIGYGSDTYTDADGNKHPVTKDTVITKDDAVRDLKRRTPEFIERIKSQIGEQAWNRLSQKSKDVLPSFAYQHGSLTGPVKAAAMKGDDEAIAQAIESDKFTPARRAREAAHIRGEGEAVPYSPPSDRAAGSSIEEAGPIQVTDPAYSGMSIQWRLQRLNQIEAEQNRIATERQKEAAVVLESSKENMLAALREHGEYTGEEPSLELFMTADPRKGYLQWKEFQVNKAAAATVNSISTMDVSEARRIRQEVRELIPKGEMADVYSRAYKDIDTAVKEREKDYDKMVGTMQDRLKAKLAKEEDDLEVGMKEAEKIVKDRRDFKKLVREQIIKEQNIRREFYIESDAQLKAGLEEREKVIEKYARQRVNNADNIYVALNKTGQFPEEDIPDRADFMVADPVNGAENYLTYLQKSWAAIASNEMFTADERRIAEIRSEAAADAKTKAGKDAQEIVDKAAKEVMAQRENDPFGAVIAHYDNAKKLWDEVKDDPTNQALKKAAVDMTFEIQRSWGMPNEVLAILPKEDSDTLVTHFKNPERATEANQRELLTLLDSYDDPGAKSAIVGQLLRDGLPKLTGPAIDAYLSKRSPIAVTNLFEAARSTQVAKGEEAISDQKLGELVHDQFIKEGGGNFYGTSVFSAYNNERFDSAVDLLTKSSRMRIASGEDQGTAITNSIKDLLGDDEPFDRRLRSGPMARVILGPDDDENKIAKGLNRFTENLVKEGMEAITKLPPVMGQDVSDIVLPTEGLVVPGTIKIDERTAYKLPTGELATEMSFSRQDTDGREVLVPQLVDGKILSQEEAWKHYKATDQHLGKFDTPEHADAYAFALHERQDLRFRENYAATAQRNLEQQNVINSVMRHGIFVNYEEGFALYNSALKRYLADENGQTMVITREQVNQLAGEVRYGPSYYGIPLIPPTIFGD